MRPRVFGIERNRPLKLGDVLVGIRLLPAQNISEHMVTTGGLAYGTEIINLYRRLISDQRILWLRWVQPAPLNAACTTVWATAVHLAKVAQGYRTLVGVQRPEPLLLVFVESAHVIPQISLA